MCLVDALGVWPDPEVADVQDVGEQDAELGFERQDVGVELVEGSLDVAGRAVLLRGTTW